MSDYVLSCCSPVDVDPSMLEEHDVHAVPFNYELGGVWYKDDFGATIAPADSIGACSKARMRSPRR